MSRSLNTGLEAVEVPFSGGMTYRTTSPLLTTPHVELRVLLGLLSIRSRPLKRVRRKLTLRRLHILVADLIILTAAIVEGVKYIIFLIKK